MSKKISGKDREALSDILFEPQRFYIQNPDGDFIPYDMQALQNLNQEKIEELFGVDVDRAGYIREKLEHSIKEGYVELGLKYMRELIDILCREQKAKP